MEMRGYPAKTEPNGLAADEMVAEKLWKVSEELNGVKFDLAQRRFGGGLKVSSDRPFGQKILMYQFQNVLCVDEF